MRRALLTTGLFLSALLAAPAFAMDFPNEPSGLNESIGYEAMMEFLREAAAEHDFISLSTEGKSIEGRDLVLVTIDRTSAADAWSLYLIGAQHGNEHAGKDALIYIIHEITKNPDLIPEDTRLYILPMANPDGVEADARRNAADADLNRDHLSLTQPEVRTIHAIQQRLMADVTVDCHEFSRNSWLDEGYYRAHLIMMGGTNHPLVDPELRDISARWVRDARSAFPADREMYGEYLVGGPPPAEMRPSTPDADDARNSLGLYGNLSFIIESGVFRDREKAGQLLGERVDAYHRLLWFLINRTEDRAQARAASQRMRTSEPPPFLPTNFFWAREATALQPDRYPVVNAQSGELMQLPSPNLMRELITKHNEATPAAYAVMPEAAERFSSLLEAYAVPFTRLEEPEQRNAQEAVLVALEEDFDDLYKRYDGRQMVDLQEPAMTELPTGALVVPVRGLEGRRAAVLLEPKMLYGLFQFPEFGEFAKEGAPLPVLRLLEE